VPESTDLSVPTKGARKLVGNATTPPSWSHSWVEHIPLIGRTIGAAMNNSRYETTLENIAEFIASDLEDPESRWVGAAVGVIDPSK
jgi:hypothetical protein